jgi:hypothetical protein
VSASRGDQLYEAIVHLGRLLAIVPAMTRRRALPDAKIRCGSSKLLAGDDTGAKKRSDQCTAETQNRASPGVGLNIASASKHICSGGRSAW